MDFHPRLLMQALILPAFLFFFVSAGYQFQRSSDKKSIVVYDGTGAFMRAM